MNDREQREFIQMTIESNNWRRQVIALERKKLFLAARCRSNDGGICTIDNDARCDIQCTGKKYIANEGTEDEYMV